LKHRQRGHQPGAGDPGASAVTLISAVLGWRALAAGHRHRVYDAVILKTLGATRARLPAPTRWNT